MNGRPISRRRLLLQAALAAGSLSAVRLAFAEDAASATPVSVLCPTPPDPAPPGVAPFAEDLLRTWESRNHASVQYESIAWPQIHQRLATGFESGDQMYNLIYMGGWAPEFHEYLEPLDELFPAAFKKDMPASSFTSADWNGNVYGVPYTLSLLTLYYNTEQLQNAGLSGPPETWDDLKAYAQELTRDGRSGWVSNYGAPGGIGGTASYWMAFLQQAGGTMYGEDGSPAFNDAAGIDALQLMIDLMPSTHQSAMSGMSILDATNVFTSGAASMMMNWPFMWSTVQDAELSSVAGKASTAVLPSGPAGTASIDGGDVWTIKKDSRKAELAVRLIQFYLDNRVQRQQALVTGWLPIRLSVLEDADLQKALPHAAAALAQARHPYNSFLTPDYDAVTEALGTEIQQALVGQKTAAEALSDASDAVSKIVKSRPAH